MKDRTYLHLDWLTGVVTHSSAEISNTASPDTHVCNVRWESFACLQATHTIVYCEFFTRY